VTWLDYKTKKMETRKVYKCVIDDENRLGVQAIGLVEEPAIEENWVYLNAVKLSAVNKSNNLQVRPSISQEKSATRRHYRTRIRSYWCDYG